MLDIVVDKAKLTFQKLPKLYPQEQHGRLSAPRPRPTAGITDLFHFYPDPISKNKKHLRISFAVSLITVLSEASHMSLGAASFCLQPSEGEGGCDRLAGAGPWGVLLGPGRPPKLPPTPKPGNENFPLLPPPGPRRWGRLPSARREEASSSIVLHGPRLRPRLQEEATWSPGPFLLTRLLTTGAEQASWGKWPQVSAALASS